MANDITALRDALFSTLAALRAGEVDVNTARGVNDLAKTLVETARVEVDFLRATGAEGATSTFLGAAVTTEAPMPRGITGVTTHRIAR